MNDVRDAIERKYVAVSIKHAERGWKFGKTCVLWGYKHPSDKATWNRFMLVSKLNFHK